MPPSLPMAKFNFSFILTAELIREALFVGLALYLTGCAVHYYDEETGVEHLWGFGHMKMKSCKPNEGLQAVVHGTETLGGAIGKADQQSYFTIGWQKLQYIDILKEDTAVRLEWPYASSFFDVRIGSDFPPETQNLQNKAPTSQKESINP